MQKKFHSISIGAHKSKLDLANDFIFVHVPKTGGMSVRYAMKSVGLTIPGSHKSVSAYQNMYGEDIFDRHDGYAVIRNPLDRLVSAYFYGRARINSNAHQERHAKELFSQDFNGFIKLIYEEREKYSKKLVIITPQSSFVSGIDGDIPVKLYSFDMLNSFISTLTKKHSGIVADTKHANRTKHAHFLDYYDDELTRMVLDVYAYDFMLYEKLSADLIGGDI